MGLLEWLRRGSLIGDEPTPVEHVATDLTIALERDASRTRLTLTGELDLSSAPAFAARLAGAERDAPPVLEIDLRGLSFMDSSGLAELFAANRRAREQDRRVVIVKDDGPIDRVLHLARVEDVIEVVDLPRN